MTDIIAKVGIISCSGEEIPEGTISRLATRRVLELLRPDKTVTICLPLFLAGNEAERDFARRHPTITIDGCDKLCAQKGTEKYSGPVSASLVVSDILSRGACHAHSMKDLTDADKEAVWKVAERIAQEVDAVLPADRLPSPPEVTWTEDSCVCTKQIPGLEIQVGGKSVTIAGLALIFDHLSEEGLEPDDSSGDKLLETVGIYHPIPTEEEQAYKTALVSAYKAYRRKK